MLSRTKKIFLLIYVNVHIFKKVVRFLSLFKMPNNEFRQKRSAELQQFFCGGLSWYIIVLNWVERVDEAIFFLST